jgi:hypothetical protein
MKKRIIKGALVGILSLVAAQGLTAGSVVAEAESSYVLHTIGRADSDGWSARVDQDNAGYLSSGPYATNLPVGPVSVTFRMMVDKTGIDSKVLTIDIYNAAAQKILGTRDINGKEFISAQKYQDFTMTVDNVAGSKLEFRVYWHDVLYVKLDKIIARQSDNVLLLVGASTNTQLKTEILQYKSDVEMRFPVKLTILEGNWKTPEEVRKVVKDNYSALGLTGVVLVGAVPMHTFYMHEGVNPNPFYYEAFDISYVDSNNDKVPESYVWQANMMKLWVANIRSVVGATDLGIDGLRTFFNKTRDYYAGNQTIERRSLSIAGSDWQGAAKSFANNVAMKLLGNAGDYLDGNAGTKDSVLKLFALQPYTIARLWLHSNESASDLVNGGINANEIYNLPNKSLITFHLGCYNSCWTRNRSGSKNNGMSWVFSKGVGQALVGGVRSGTLYGEDKLYAALIAGKYLGPAYFACKSAGEAEMHSEYPDGSVVAGNLLIGNPFIQVSQLAEIQQPVTKPVVSKPTSVTNESSVRNVNKELQWNISKLASKLLIDVPVNGYFDVELYNINGKLVVRLFSGDINQGKCALTCPGVSSGAYLFVVKNRNGDRLFSKEFKTVEQ